MSAFFLGAPLVMSADGGTLVSRIRRLAQRPAHDTGLRPWRPVGALAVSLVLVVGLAMIAAPRHAVAEARWGEPAGGLRCRIAPVPAAQVAFAVELENVSDQPFSTWYSGWTLSGRIALLPQQTIIRDAGNLAIARSRQEAEGFEHVTNRKLVAPPGTYWLQLSGRLGHGWQLKDRAENVLAPLEGDWRGDCETARNKLVVRAPATLPKLRKLNIGSTRGRTRAGLARLADLQALESLQVYNVNQAEGLGDEVIRGIVGLESLRELSIGECGTTDAGIRLREQMPQLTHLSLYQEGRLTRRAMRN